MVLKVTRARELRLAKKYHLSVGDFEDNPQVLQELQKMSPHDPF